LLAAGCWFRSVIFFFVVAAPSLLESEGIQNAKTRIIDPSR
jgi:hypothetical protein